MTSGIRMAIEDLEVKKEQWRAGRVAIRCDSSWAEWLGGLSRFCRVPSATVIDQALTRFAEQVGFPGPPPRNGGQPDG
jgi:hypothetical protein